MVTSTLKRKGELDPSQRLAGVCILLVEDEPDIVNLLFFILDSVGAEAVTVTDAETAWAQLEALQPDLLLCNAKLPRENGEWLIHHIRRHPQVALKHLPAIALTSYTRETSEGKALAASFDRFLVKFEPSLVDEIVQLLATRP